MGQAVFNYPNNQAVRIYTALAKIYHVDVEGLTNAQAKSAVDAAIRLKFIKDIRQLERQEKEEADAAAHEASYSEVEIT